MDCFYVTFIKDITLKLFISIFFKKITMRVPWKKVHEVEQLTTVFSFVDLFKEKQRERESLTDVVDCLIK